MSISDQLRAAILNYESVNALAEDSGVSQSVLQRFVAEERDVRLATVDRLAAFFGLELNMADQSGPLG